MKHINRCRLYLQVTTLSDFLEGDSHTLSKDALNGKLTHSTPTRYRWPTQQRPYQKAWEIWRRTLKSVFPSQRGVLIQGSGRWIDDRYPKWRWYYSSCRDAVYHRLPSGIQMYTRQGIRGPRGRFPRFRVARVVRFVPLHAYRATCCSSHISAYIMGWSREKEVPIKVSTSITLSHSLLDTKPDWIVEQYSCADKGKSITNSI